GWPGWRWCQRPEPSLSSPKAVRQQLVDLFGAQWPVASEPASGGPRSQRPLADQLVDLLRERDTVGGRQPVQTGSRSPPPLNGRHGHTGERAAGGWPFHLVAESSVRMWSSEAASSRLDQTSSPGTADRPGMTSRNHPVGSATAGTAARITAVTFSRTGPLI